MKSNLGLYLNSNGKRIIMKSLALYQKVIEKEQKSSSELKKAALEHERSLVLETYEQIRQADLSPTETLIRDLEALKREKKGSLLGFTEKGDWIEIT